MAERKIDYDLGVKIRTMSQMGMDIFMYKQKPGYYYNAHGHEVSEAFAKMAGYDVDRHKLERRRQEAIGAAARAYDSEQEKLTQANIREVVKEKNGYKVVNIGHGRHLVEDPDGNVLTQGVTLTADMALGILEHMLVSEGVEVEELPKKQEVPAGSGARDRGAGRLGATPLRTN